MSSKPYRFVGAYTIVHTREDLNESGHELKEFGQQAQLTDEQLETVLRGGGLLIPEADFFTIFSKAEYSARTFPKFPGHWLGASDELKAKKKAAVTLATNLHYEAVKRLDAETAEHAVTAAARHKKQRLAELVSLGLQAEAADEQPTATNEDNHSEEVQN